MKILTNERLEIQPYIKMLTVSLTKSVCTYLSMFAINTYERKEEDAKKRMIILHLTHIISVRMCKIHFFSFTLSWLVEIVRKDARVHTSVSWQKRRFVQIYECMKEKFLWCLCDNDVSSFFLSPSACDLSSVYQLDSLCLGMMRFILRSWEEKVFFICSNHFFWNIIAPPLAMILKFFSLQFISLSILSVEECESYVGNVKKNSNIRMYPILSILKLFSRFIQVIYI